MKSYTEISQLKYKLEDQTLREWAVKFGIVDIASKIEVYPKICLGSVIVDRRMLSSNDKSVIQKVIDWLHSKD